MKDSDYAFEFTAEAMEAMDRLKHLATTAPVLISIDYQQAKLINPLVPRKSDEGLVSVAVDAAALYGAGWVVYQTRNGDKKPAIYGSCTYNDRENRYSQPKAELFGVFRAFKHLRHRIWGIHFCLEHDAKFLKEMIMSPDLPNSPMTRWIAYLLLFDFDMKHIKADSHKAPDGLSRRPRSADDSDEEDAEEFLDRFIGNSKRIAGTSEDQDNHTTEELDTNEVKCLLSSLHFQSRALDQMNSTTGVSYAPVEEDSSPTGKYRAFVSSVEESEPHFDTYVPREPRTYNFAEEQLPHAEPDSIFTQSLLRNTDVASFVGYEFFDRHTPVELADNDCLLGDEIVSLPITYYVSTFKGQLSEGASPPEIIKDKNGYIHGVREGNRTGYSWVDCPDEHDHNAVREQIACIGHKFGTKDEDGEDFWKEINDFLRKEILPERCLKDDKERKKFLRKCERYFINDDRLWLKGKKGALPRLVILDTNRRKELLLAAHDHCGHRGRDPTYEHLRDRYWWPNMYDMVAYYTRSCRPCQLNARRKPIVPYKNARVPTILRHFHLDTIHMPEGYGGKHYVLQATDSLSGWPEAEAQAQSTWLNTAKFIYKNIISRFSCIPLFTVDHGSEFARIAEILQEQFGVVVLFSSAYHPEGNGVVERAHQVLVDGLFKTCEKDKSKWPLYLDAVLFAIRVTTSRTTGYSPFFLIYGIHPVFSFDLDDATWQTLDWDKVQDTPTLIALRAQQIARRDEVAAEAHRQARLTRSRAIEDFNRKFKNQLSFTDFEVGMWVLRHETWLEGQKGNKDAWRWSGPYIIHEKRPNDSYVLRELDGTVIRGHVTVHRLKLFYYRSDQHLLRSVSPSRFDYISSFPNKKDLELRNFYARYVHHNFEVSLSQDISYLLPIVTYLPGSIYYPTNRDLQAPDLWSDYPTLLDLCDKNDVALGAKMARTEAHVTFTSYLAEPRFHRQFKILTLDPAIGHSQHYRETAKFVNPSAYRPCFDR